MALADVSSGTAVGTSEQPWPDRTRAWYAVGVFAIAVLTTRMISVGSVSAAVALAVAAIATDSPRLVSAGAAIAAVLVVYRHRGNLSRLIAGTERRVGGA